MATCRQVNGPLRHVAQVYGLVAFGAHLVFDGQESGTDTTSTPAQAGIASNSKATCNLTTIHHEMPGSLPWQWRLLVRLFPRDACKQCT